jgi:hypothetical protein
MKVGARNTYSLEHTNHLIDMESNREVKKGLSLSKFHDDLIEGGAIKELIKVLLEKSGYTVYPYGYESTFSDVRRKLTEKETKNSRTVRRIRSSPDFLVYDEIKKDLMLVEVKMRRAPKENKILIYGEKIAGYKEFWNDSILVIVVPCSKVFYAQGVSELEVRQEYDATTDFQRLEDIFTRVKEEDVVHFREKALKSLEKRE